MNESTYPVRLPYDEMGPLELDPVTLDHGASWRASLEWLAGGEGIDAYTAEEVARVITSAALLLAAGAGTVDQCLDTAIVWERG
jgi:hypothetical protein